MAFLLEGTVENIIFSNEDNGYTVLRLMSTDGEAVTVVGYLPNIFPGELLSASGHWEDHREYGEQFVVESSERLLPETREGIILYLSSGPVKGVGLATARLIVKKFGEAALQVMADSPEDLTVIRGITPKKAREIGESFRRQTGLRRLADFLSSFHLNSSLANLLFDKYGMDALDYVEQNPYLLVNDAFGVSFSQVDQIALDLGISGDSPFRLESAILYELEHNLNNGHVFLPKEKLVNATAHLLEQDPSLIESALLSLQSSRHIIMETVSQEEACYLRAYHEAELYVCEKMCHLLSGITDTWSNTARVLDDIQKEQGITYAAQQIAAVETAATEGILLLTGGPGTGKTTSLRGIVALFERMGLEVSLAAPTGRAAKRLGEACNRDAQTIHRLLGMAFNEVTHQVAYSKDETHPLTCNAIIVDEMSMVDLPLMSALLHALRPGTRLIMVGDPDQLPSVGPGNVFGDLIRSGVIPVVALTEIFRQAQASAIIRNAHAVNEGVFPSFQSNQGDYFFLSRTVPQGAAETVVDLCQNRLPQNMHISPAQIQVLSPTRKGECGTAQLNAYLQKALNPPNPGKAEMRFGDMVFRLGDRVMQNKNDYDVCWQKESGLVGSGIFNGDIGQIVRIDKEGEYLQILFDDRLALYAKDMLAELELAYAITVHKAQGSEYPVTIMVAPPGLTPSLSIRGVLYTAITRAKEMLIMVGSETTVCAMTENNRQQRRYSGLRWRLKHAFEVETNDY